MAEGSPCEAESQNKKGGASGLRLPLIRREDVVMFGFKKKKVTEYDPAADWPHLKPHPLRGYTNFGMFEAHSTNPKTGSSNKFMILALDSSDALRVAAEIHGWCVPLPVL